MAAYPPQRPCIDAMTALGWQAPLHIVAKACASGTNAIGMAADFIRAGRAACVVCGGYDPVSELVFVGFDAMQASSAAGECRPFDRERSGLVLGEGAAILLLEDWESAAARGAVILGEVMGCGVSTDTSHMTQPHPSGIGPEMAMRRALADAGITPADVGYINAHGTATTFNDATEGLAIQNIFGPEGVPVSSTKALTGHTLGAAGAIEAVFTLACLSEGWLPASHGFRNGDEGIHLDVVKDGGRETQARIALSNSFGFGGVKAALVLASGVGGSDCTRRSAGWSAAPASGTGILGLGMVSGYGVGVDEFVAGVQAGQPAPRTQSTIGTTGNNWTYVAVPEEAVAAVAKEKRLRRASPISHFGVAAGLDAIRCAEARGERVEPSALAIVFAVATGGVQYTRRFFTQILESGASAASPLLFPETVYNAPASHLAAILGVDGGVYTLVGDSAAGLGALRFADTLLEDRADIRHVLVVASEEADWVMAEAYRVWGLQGDGTGQGHLFAKGACAMLLGRKGQDGSDPIAAIAPEFFDGIYLSPREAESLACRLAAGEVPEPDTSRILALSGNAVGASGLAQAVFAAALIKKQSDKNTPRRSRQHLLVRGLSGMAESSALAPLQ